MIQNELSYMSMSTATFESESSQRESLDASVTKVMNLDARTYRAHGDEDNKIHLPKVLH